MAISQSTPMGSFDLRRLVAELARAYFSNSRVTSSDISTVIHTISVSLAAVATDEGRSAGLSGHAAAARATAAEIRRSITPDALISFEDGRPYKTLRRHLSSRGLTPADYRAKWGLPPDYPMTAESYSASRSELARRMGLSGHGIRARRQTT